MHCIQLAHPFVAASTTLDPNRLAAVSPVTSTLQNKITMHLRRHDGMHKDQPTTSASLQQYLPTL